MLLMLLAALAQDPTPLHPVRPPDNAALRQALPTAGKAAPTLKAVSATPNQVTDVDAWFAKVGMGPPVVDRPPEWVPESWSELPRLQVIDAGNGSVAALYGADRDASHVLIYGPAGELRAAWDLSAWLPAKRAVPGDEAYVQASVRWVQVAEGVAYINVAHRTYARSSYGKNAWITAVDLATGEWRWQSEPLVCNAENFLVLGDHLVCGYGFTAEPDALVVLHRGTGKTVARTRLKTGPEHLLLKEGTLYVRTYDTDYVFSVQ